jgi:hypothetical protein
MVACKVLLRLSLQSAVKALLRLSLSSSALLACGLLQKLEVTCYYFETLALPCNLSFSLLALQRKRSPVERCSLRAL